MTTAARKLYFVSAPVDFAFIGGLSLFTLAAFWMTTGGELSLVAAQWSVYLSWVINWPHFSATSYRLFRRKENIREYPLTALFVPVLVIAGVVASLLEPALIAPFFVKLFLIWSPYHFSGQNVGISLLYARRAGVPFSIWERRALTIFIFSTFLAPTLASEVGNRTMEYYGIVYASLNLPAWTAVLARAALLISGIGICIAGILRAVRGQPLIPWICLLPAITQFGWFILGGRVMSFYYFVPMFHSLQYLLIAWAMQLAERRGESSRIDSSFGLRETAWWSVVNIIGGAILFAGLPYLVSFTGVSLALATGILISGVQIHHFLVDGVIWKLRNPKVASPLMSSVHEFLSPRKAA